LLMLNTLVMYACEMWWWRGSWWIASNAD
jgi:hypothetical protein